MKLASVLLVIAACGSTPPPTPKPIPTPVPDPQQPVAPTPTPTAKKATGKPKTDLIPRALLFGNPERANMQISPDGKHLAWLAPKDGVLNVWVAPVDKIDQAKAVTSDTTRPIRNYFWAFTNKHLLYTQDAGGDENFHLFRTDLDGKATDLTPGKGFRVEVAGLSHERPTKVVISINDRDAEAMDLHVLDLVDGKRTLLQQNDEKFLDFGLDEKDQVRYASKKTPDGATVLYLPDGPKKWKEWEKIAFEDAETTSPIAMVPGKKAVYFNESRGRDTAALVEIDLQTKKQKLMAEDPRADVGGVIRHPTKYTIQAVSFEYDRERWHFFDQTIKKDFDALAKVEPGTEVSIASRTLDDKTWLVVLSSDVTVKVYKWNRATQKATFLFSPRPKLFEQPLVKMHPVIIDARDGLKLVSYLTLPKSVDPNGSGKASSPAPMVLLVHGGPWGRDAWGYNSLHQLLANRGYAVLSVNYRGSTGFGKKFGNAANLQWGKAMHTDLLDAVDWAVKQGVTQKTDVCIMGGSYGGYATLAGLTMTPDVFKCGVDIVGPSNLLTLFGSIPPYWAPFVTVFHARVGNPNTPDGKALLVEASPLTHVKKISKPLLIGQGANDPRVKQAESEQIVAAMKSHGLPVTYALFPDEGHGFARPENRVAFFAITEAFLSAHLGGYYEPVTDEIKKSTMQVKDGQDGIPGL